MKIEKKKLDELVSPEWNPRTISDEELNKLRKSIEEFGYSDPLIVNKRNNHIVAGNQRFKVLKKLNKSKDYNFDEIDVVIVDLDETYEKAFNIAHNKIDAEFDDDKLKMILNEIKVEPIDINLTGFDNFELESYFDDIVVEEIKEVKEVIVEKTPEKPKNAESNKKNVENINKTEKSLKNNPSTEIKIEEKRKEEKIDLKPSNKQSDEHDEETIKKEKKVIEPEPIITKNEHDVEETSSEEEIDEEKDFEEEIIEKKENQTKETYRRPDPYYLPVAPIKKIIKDAGAERVSDNAARYLGTVLEENAKEISEKAVMMANVAGRKTIVDEDFEILLKN